MLEAIELCEEIAGRELAGRSIEENRIGDHRWWISDLDQFRHDYPEWNIERKVPEILREIRDHNAERWEAVTRSRRS